jgi:hypothetical protein
LIFRIILIIAQHLILKTQNNEPLEKDDTVKTEAKNEEINKLASQIDELKSQISKLNKEKIN